MCYQYVVRSSGQFKPTYSGYDYHEALKDIHQQRWVLGHEAILTRQYGDRVDIALFSGFEQRVSWERYR